MMPPFLLAALGFLVALALTALATPVVRRVALDLGQSADCDQGKPFNVQAA